MKNRLTIAVQKKGRLFDQSIDLIKKSGINFSTKGDNLSYREIAAKLKTSTTTVTRVARFLSSEPYQGYKRILKRINK